jgi:RNA polymerase sigma-70 factor (ECF subfamily)
MGRLANLVRRLRGIGPRDGAVPSDQHCLEQFLARRDPDAFAVLVERHGPVVMGVCRRVLGHAADAEDAFQATFLVLVRKAGSLSSRELLGNWLYGVALRTALKARTMAAKRRAREQPAAEVPERAADRHNSDDQTAVLDEELAKLPEKYRLPIVLCELEGKSHQEAAALLGWPIGTLSGRLSRARKRLAEQLTRRGVTLGSAGLGGLLSQQAGSAVSPAAARATAALAAKVAASGLVGGGVSASVIALTEGSSCRCCGASSGNWPPCY